MFVQKTLDIGVPTNLTNKAKVGATQVRIPCFLEKWRETTRIAFRVMLQLVRLY